MEYKDKEVTEYPKDDPFWSEAKLLRLIDDLRNVDKRSIDCQGYFDDEMVYYFDIEEIIKKYI